MTKGIALSPGRSFALVFVVAFAVRACLLPLTPEELIRDPGSELGKIARSLASTGEFANPYSVPTGPTAHLPPVYAGLVGLIYALFGVTAAADYVRCFLVIASFSAMYALIPWLPSAAMVLGMALACVPWAWRNYRTFHDVFFIRSNFGLELRIANQNGAGAGRSVDPARDLTPPLLRRRLGLPVPGAGPLDPPSSRGVRRRPARLRDDLLAVAPGSRVGRVPASVRARAVVCRE